MNRRKEIESLLSENEFVSGQEIANSLGISRNAVWKVINKLKESGYEIESIPKKGYRISTGNDVITETNIRKYLRNKEQFSIEVYGELDSTNNRMKLGADYYPEWQTIIATSQTGGRGRLGRRFYSPSDTGIYLSILLRPTFSADKSLQITTTSALAACKAIEDCTNSVPEIKWVNDIFINQLKVCGILTEGSFNLESNGFNWVVMGIGFNVYPPKGEYPRELKGIAGPIVQNREPNLKSRLIASFLDNFSELYSDLSSERNLEEYKKRCFLIGKKVNICQENCKKSAIVLDIDSNYGLVVQYDNQVIKTLNSGEISIKEWTD